MSLLHSLPAGAVVPATPMPLVTPPTFEAAARVRVGSSTEPLVRLQDPVAWVSAYQELGIGPDRGPLRVRAGVFSRLLEARRDLPAGFDLLVLDGWRDMAFQSLLLRHYRSLELNTSGYVSDPSETRIVPPHVTGGAVDLTLAYEGIPLALGTDFDAFDSQAHFDAEQADHPESVLGLRALLYTTMLGAGFSPYPLEWWHWSYGDQWWAAFTGRDESLFGLVELPSAFT